VHDTTLLDIEVVEVKDRCEGQQPIEGPEGRIPFKELEAQQEILPDKELVIAAKEPGAVRTLGTHPCGHRAVTKLEQRIAHPGEDKERVLAQDRVVAFKDVLPSSTVSPGVLALPFM
jgi:hypothetical protein